MLKQVRISLDLDDTLTSFYNSYKSYFKADKNPKVLNNSTITKNVYKLRTNKDFWLSLNKIDDIDFEPINYCTKRINPKQWSREWLINNGFPNKPIYQMYYQQGNKADLIKGRCDVLIDDSVSNVVKCINSGVPALLIDRPHNQWFGPMFRIYSLCIDEILDAYNIFMEYHNEYIKQTYVRL